ncbi:DUF342 domain-containing protein [Desulfobacter latus]|uniref:DUF342 domain-containing protein n=1 Tax=Desulfobacter latus TaxID=2292 RepID=A0A850SXW1_9BACT|nr:FapA family protein [Desulfobacter latus]NWH06154.1 DUF342 domain-containing protein [Desulfobacter latus]
MGKYKPSNKDRSLLKIALFLKYISKGDLAKLESDIRSPKAPGFDLFTHIKAKGYMSQENIKRLKQCYKMFGRQPGDMRFGELCIAFGFLTPLSLEQALEEQKRLTDKGISSRLGSLLVSRGMMTKAQCKLVLCKQQTACLKQSPPSPSSPPEQPPLDSTTCVSSCELPDFCGARLISEKELGIYIAKDALTVWLVKRDGFNDEIDPVWIKNLMEKYGIVHGIRDDNALQGFLDDPQFSKIPFQAASGTPAVEETDAVITCLFEQEYLKPGILSDDGTMDFKARGDMPFVKQGDVLMEKTPVVPGKDGINIFGDLIPQKAGANPKLHAGKGVSLSEDGLKVIADIEGNPRLDDLNIVSVNESIIIEGDVDYRTGHIKYNKNIFVTGVIKNGFKVEGIDVAARYVEGGQIKARGNVLIEAGVTDSEIEARGGIEAGFIHRSKIACAGQIKVQKEMVDSLAMTEGRFNMDLGRLFSSEIHAKGGARIYKVGSKKAKPSSITVGKSAYLEGRRQTIETEIDTCSTLMEQARQAKSQIANRLQDISRQLGDYEKSMERTMGLMERMEKKSRDSLEMFQQTLDDAGDKIIELKGQKSNLKSSLEVQDEQIEDAVRRFKQGLNEKFILKRLAEAHPAHSVLEVTGKIAAKTKVCGPDTAMVLKQSLIKARFMEVSNRGDGKRPPKKEMAVAAY